MQLHQPYALNETGGRQNQEDSIFPKKGKATRNSRFFLLCDGMGGHEAGETAAGIVCESFAEFLDTINPEKLDKTVFEQALSYAYDRLDENYPGESINKKMGTTLAFISFNSFGALMAHIGDSRIYHLRKAGDREEICYKSQDHLLVADLVLAGIITPEEAENHSKKNILTRAMQPHETKRCKAEITETADVKAGDYFFLCSDGVLEQVNDRKLIEIIAANTAAEQKIKAVYSLCQGKSQDNFSAYLIEIAEGVI